MKQKLSLVIGGGLALFVLFGAGYLFSPSTLQSFTAPIKNSKTNMSYHTNIVKSTQENKNFRTVLFTGKQSQLVVMSIPPGGGVGEETHRYTEQTLFFLSGTGEGSLNEEQFPIGPGDVVVVVPGTKHNFRNTGTEALKLYTVYAPPNHIDGRIHQTKADADADSADEAVGESRPSN